MMNRYRYLNKINENEEMFSFELTLENCVAHNIIMENFIAIPDDEKDYILNPDHEEGQPEYIEKPIDYIKLAKEKADAVIEAEKQTHSQPAVFLTPSGQLILDYSDETYDICKRGSEDIKTTNIPCLETSDEVLNFLTLTTEDLDAIVKQIFTQRNIWHDETIAYLKRIKNGELDFEVVFSAPVPVTIE